MRIGCLQKVYSTRRQRHWMPHSNTVRFFTLARLIRFVRSTLVTGENVLFKNRCSKELMWTSMTAGLYSIKTPSTKAKKIIQITAIQRFIKFTQCMWNVNRFFNHYNLLTLTQKLFEYSTTARLRGSSSVWIEIASRAEKGKKARKDTITHTHVCTKQWKGGKSNDDNKIITWLKWIRSTKLYNGQMDMVCVCVRVHRILIYTYTWPNGFA